MGPLDEGIRALDRVGFIGLGSQGAPMARRIIDAGVPTTLWARRSETLAPFRDTDATFAPTLDDLAATSDLVCICVLADADVEEVVSGVLPRLAPGAVIAVHSTVHPATCTRLESTAAARGVSLVDAPVSGGSPAARAGALLVMVGGDAGAVERCLPVFRTFGDPIVHLGPTGSGQIAKLVNNALFTAHAGVADHAYALGEALGLDREALHTVLRHGSGNSSAVSVMADRTMPTLGHVAGRLLKKDLDIVAAVADARGAPSALIDVADDALRRMGVAR